VKGKLIGGCDIVMEMEEKGELGEVLESAGT
jgi:glutaredoxin-related protein